MATELKAIPRRTRRQVVLSVFVTVGVLASLLFSTGQADADTIDSENYKRHDFENSSLGPFTEDQGFTGDEIFSEGMGFHNDGQGGQRLKLTWKESEYDGTRRERGHEIKLGVVDSKELYNGFYWRTPSGQNNTLLDDGKNTIIWQMYNWNSDGCSNWTAHLTLKGDDLYLSYRPACVSPTEVLVMNDVPADEDLAFQIRAVASRQNQGLFEIRVNGETKLITRNINFGFGEFDNQDRMAHAVMGVKMGIYAADVNGYTDNERRIVYLDNMSVSTRWGSVANSFNRVDPRRM